MPNTRNTIMTAIKTAVLNAGGLDASRVKMGLWWPQDAIAEPRVFIYFTSDVRKSKSEGKVERDLFVTVGCIVLIDESKAEAQQAQMGTIYDAIHAEVEKVADTNLGGTVQEMKETTDGIQTASIDDADRIVFMGASWRVEYKRTQGET